MFCILWNSLANIWVVLLVPYYLLEWFTSATFKTSAEKTEMWTSSPNQFCAAGNFDNCKNWFSMVPWLHQDQTLLWFLQYNQTLVWVELAQNNCWFKKFWFKGVTSTKKSFFSPLWFIFFVPIIFLKCLEAIPLKNLTPPFIYTLLTSKMMSQSVTLWRHFLKKIATATNQEMRH